MNNVAIGVIEYDVKGKPICKICKKSFHRVLTHARQKHNISEKKYKLKFGLDLGKGICSKKSAKKSRIKTLLNYRKCIIKNLILKGKKTRFEIGSNGRTKDLVQPQTKIALIERLKTPKMIKAMKLSGKKLGKSGFGNIKRWGLKTNS